MRAADHVHVGGPEFLGGEAAVAVLEAARSGRHHVGRHAGARASRCGWTRIAGCLPLVDLFLPNDEQLLGLTGDDHARGRRAGAARQGRRLRRGDPGRRGAYVATAEETAGVPAFEIDVVDTTGCGDSFSAGFLLGLAHGRDLVVAATLGCATAAQVAQGLSTDAGSYDLASVDEFAANASPLTGAA